MKKFHLMILMGCLAFGAAAAQDNMAGDSAAAPQAEAVAQEPAADQNQEAGKYARKSVSFVNALWLLDASTRGMKPEMVSYMLNKVQQGISMKRFDYNALPDTMVQSFVDAANAKDKLSIDDVAKLMEEQLVPQIMKILEAEREMRAANLLTDQQKNSFITDKAKELGVTGEQLERIMNSAYLYLPVISDFSLIKTGSGNKESWKCMAKCGILWYSLSVKGDQPKVTMRVKKMTMTMGLAKVKTGLFSNYTVDGESVTPEQYAFRSMVRSGVKNLVVATQTMPEFKLSGQVLEVAGRNVGFDLGKNEGLRMDDKYRIMVLTEAADGSINQEAAGWGIVNLVGDSSSKEGYKSKAQVIAGAPGIGAVMMEYPRLGIDISANFRTFPGVKDTEDDEVFGSGVGIQFDARYDVGRLFNWSQLFVGLGYGIGGTSTVGSLYPSYDGAAYANLDFFALQRFYISRFTVGAELGWASQSLTTSATVFGVPITTSFSGSGLFVGGNAGIAILPSLNLEAGARYEMGTIQDASGDLDHSGLGIRAGVTYSPAALPIDPWEMLRGSMGW